MSSSLLWVLWGRLPAAPGGGRRVRSRLARQTSWLGATLAFVASGSLLAAQENRPVYLGELRKRSPETARVLRPLGKEDVSPAQLQGGLDALYRARVGDTLLKTTLLSKAAPREARYLGARAWVEVQVERRLAQ
ncbi:MAG: hypothetical protein JKY65_18755, partial [Planctomycetes bacterium]|nr:hypothetical protein [Planctomycetota bacterium]